MALHRAARGQPVALAQRLAVHHRIEHLRRHRVALAQQRPLVDAVGVPAHPIAAHHFAQAVRVRAVRKRVQDLRFVDRAGHLQVFDRARLDRALGAEQQNARLLGHSTWSDSRKHTIVCWSRVISHHYTYTCCVYTILMPELSAWPGGSMCA